MKQGTESMQDFGPKLLLVITTITKDNFILQMSYFHDTVNEEVVRAVLPTKPKTTHEAVQSAIDMETGLKRIGSTYIGPKHSSPANAFEYKDDPMIIDQNYQRSRDKFKKGDQKKKCYIFDRSNQIVKDCYYLKKAKAAMPDHNEKKDKRPKKLGTHRSNLQQVTSVQSGSISSDSNQKIDENDLLDFTDNIFYKLYNQNSQGYIEEEQYVPNAMGGLRGRTNFSLPCVIKTTSNTNAANTTVLIDTGAMISSISEEEATKLGLQVEDAPL
ncbi:hypothetical protein A0J61_11173 [Choanephora cucurbitarum]|uniref:Uncharacterized protein n=1 Tax=Choanephora cucurbitarum TaxID=101091 RepID=A0A1C7MVK0_9FUNG|nr:hypothetical protein A0J61_11173 [Choanephora cucurbitarum]